MYNYGYSDKLKEILEKLSKKDKSLYEQVLKKIEEVINSLNAEHYKNLKFPMNEFKRVHIGHFVLIFRFDKQNKMIYFEDFDHHDKVYKKI